MMEGIALQVKEVHALGVETAVVVGGGNIIRGVNVSEAGFDRATGDYMGMLATIINSLALQNALEKNDVDTRVLSAIHVSELAEPFIRRRAIRHLEKKRIVIFAAGTGSPYFSTDTAAALRAMEIRADVILKGTKVDGVYDSDPQINTDAKRYDRLKLSSGSGKRPQGHGRNGHILVHGSRSPDHSVQSAGEGEHHERGPGQQGGIHHQPLK